MREIDMQQRNWLTLAAMAGMLLQSACSPEVTTPRPGTGDLGNQAMAALDQPTTLDDWFLQIEAQVPGFGGLYIGVDGSPVVLLTDTTLASKADSAVASVLATLPGDIPSRTVLTRQVSFSFGQLSAWRDSLYQHKEATGVTLVDVEENNNRLFVGVSGKEYIEPIKTILRQAWAPDLAFAVEVQAPPHLLNDLTDIARPTMGGITIALVGAYSCTMGFLAKRSSDLTHRFFVTNSHCTAIPWGYDGGAVNQPIAGYLVGHEVVDPPLTHFTGCPTFWNAGCRWSDAALIRFDSNAAFFSYDIAQTLFVYGGMDSTQSGSKTLAAEPFVVNAEYASNQLILGLTLSKVGITSGWTQGPIIRTCWDAQPLKCVYSLNAVSRSGDSGSPVFSYGTSPGGAPIATLAGILFGSFNYPTYVETSFSPLSGIRTDLGSDLIVKTTVH